MVRYIETINSIDNIQSGNISFTHGNLEQRLGMQSMRDRMAQWIGSSKWKFHSVKRWLLLDKNSVISLVVRRILAGGPFDG